MAQTKNKEKRNYVETLSSILAIVTGLLVGLVVLFLCNPSQALSGFGTILTGASTHSIKGIRQIFYYIMPTIFIGLSVGLAFKAGLFNIGTPGQSLVGGSGAVYVGILRISLGRGQWVAALIASIILGAAWGLVPGLLEAYFNADETISSTMMNYIGLHLVNWIVKSYKPLSDNLRNESKNIAANVVIPKIGMNKLFPGSSVNGGIIITVTVVIIIYVVLNKTTLGFELEAVGLNRDVSKYAGINEKQSIIKPMIIVSTIAGLAGGFLYLAGTGKHIEVKDVLGSGGFTDISVAPLGLSHSIGVLFSGIFIAYSTTGGFYPQLFESLMEIIDIIVAVIIYFSVFALVVKSMIEKFQKKKDGGDET